MWISLIYNDRPSGPAPSPQSMSAVAANFQLSRVVDTLPRLQTFSKMVKFSIKFPCSHLSNYTLKKVKINAVRSAC